MKFHSKPIPEHEEVPLADEGRLEKIVEHWTNRDSAQPIYGQNQSSCYVVSVGTERDISVRNAQLAEIVNLVRAQGDQVVGSEIYHLNSVNPRTVLGKGTSQALAARARARNADMLVLDAELTPSQMRNLEDAAGIPICDREGVILNVFRRNARTDLAKVQVEIAQLEYLRPRIRGVGINMDQQTGGMAGSRGPGETASELLARKLDFRLTELKKTLRRLRQAGQTRRKSRNTCERIALIGYTNAGKTSLMNALTAEALSARNMPFETLDTTSRNLSRHGSDVIISDTVGFIRRLPERLLASFESTLVEIREATLLVIVIDLADYEWRSHIETTLDMLTKLQVTNLPRFYLFNKSDCLETLPDREVLEQLSNGHPYTALSSRDKSAILRLKEALLSIVRSKQTTLKVFVPYSAGKVLSMIYGRCRVTRSEPKEEGVMLSIEGESHIIEQVKHHLKGVLNETN